MARIKILECVCGHRANEGQFRGGKCPRCGAKVAAENGEWRTIKVEDLPEAVRSGYKVAGIAWV